MTDEVWICRDGTKIKVVRMTDEHLRRALAWLQHLASRPADPTLAAIGRDPTQHAPYWISVLRGEQLRRQLPSK